MKYKQRKDYEGIEVLPNTLFRFYCCDCGLVHDMTWAIEYNNSLGLVFIRNNRATAQIRRHRFSSLKKLIEK